jgi:hypothetical protein
MKKLTGLLATILTFTLWFGGISPAFAQNKPPVVIGTTEIFTDQTQQMQQVEVYQKIGYSIANPFKIPAESIPATKEEFDEKVVPKLVKMLGDGSVNQARFDFKDVEGSPSENQVFTVYAPLGQKIYSVVAGQPAEQCPLEIKDTQISFFIDEEKAKEKANELDKQGYFIYVSPVQDLRKKVLDNFYDQYSPDKNTSCFVITGETKKVSIDFKEIFNLLPTDLQQPARQKPFVFTPKATDAFLYVVNARKVS